MKLHLLSTLSYFTLLGFLSAQAPDGWTQTKEKKIIEVKGKKATQYGEWSSADGTRTAIVVDIGDVTTIENLGQQGAGMMSGVLRSGVYPLKFESRNKPHPTLLLRGQVEHEGGEYFQDTYAVLTQRGLLMIKVNGLQKEVPFDIEKWNLGEPIKDNAGDFGGQMKKLAEDLNDGLAKFQDLVKKLRKATKKP